MRTTSGSESMIGFGLAGCGHAARKHAEALRVLQAAGVARLVSAYDPDQRRSEELAREFGAEHDPNLSDLLERDAVQVLAICTPSGLRLPLVEAAAQAGKHLLVEKPMALSLSEADTLIDTCRSAGVILGVVHPHRFQPAVGRLRGALEAGAFGKLTHASALLRWHRPQSYYDASPWRGTTSMDGGLLFNQAIHCLDLLLWTMGPVESASAYLTTRLRRIETEDTAAGIMRFGGGALGVLEASITVYPENLEESLAVFGENGTAVLGGASLKEIVTWRFAGPGEGRVADALPDLPTWRGHAAVIADLCASLLDRRRPLVDGEEARKVLELIVALQESARKGSPVTLAGGG
ncbi:MAG: Gfo/Idh/MocA family oxidoreductase [Firmicutes bacterium]|nr:Gfo/Idh/MocA family oxidoreductase [Bacillota bacterium]